MLQQIVTPDGVARKFGNVSARGVKVRGTFREFGSTPAARVIPQVEWDGLLKGYTAGPDHPGLGLVVDQKSCGECNAAAAAELMDFCRGRQGLARIPLSAADLYDRINGGVDDGSMLEDAMAELLARGIGTVATSGFVWNEDFRGPAPAAERAKFKALEVFVCPTFVHQFSAVLQGFGVVSGVMWFGNYTPDRDGWLPNGQQNVGGHAIFGFKPASRGGEYGIWHRQSWGPNWHPATDNCFVLPESAYSGPVGGWYAVREVVDEGGVVPSETAA